MAKHKKPLRLLYPDARSTSLRRYSSAFRLWLRRAAAISAVALLAAVPGSARAQAAKDVGVGVIAGDPTGGTAKVWLDKQIALDFGVGFSGDAAFWGDALYHMDNLLPQPAEGRLSVYLGAGPRIETGSEAEFGVRTIAGLSWRINKQPLEFFAEAGPLFRVTQGGGVGADGGIGVRIYLGSR